MAVVTATVIELYGGALSATVTYDDVTLELVSVRIVNTDPVRSFAVQIKRGQGQNWQDRIVGPGFDQTFNAGGPVKSVDDIPEWRAGDA